MNGFLFIIIVNYTVAILVIFCFIKYSVIIPITTKEDDEFIVTSVSEGITPNPLELSFKSTVLN